MVLLVMMGLVMLLMIGYVSSYSVRNNNGVRITCIVIIRTSSTIAIVFRSR
jgi:hypothetical protein